MDGLRFNTDINAYSTYGIMMGDGFLDALLAPVPLKSFPENKSRLSHGTTLYIKSANIRKDSRSFNLTFQMHGSSPSDLQSKRTAFYNLLYAGELTIWFTTPDMGTQPTSEKFHLVYDGQSTTYAMDLTQTGCKITCKFTEPNPNNRA